MSSFRRVLYVGVTNDLATRVQQHRDGETPGFTSRYNVDRLVYAETAPDPQTAIAREKQIKRWRREKKLRLIGTINPGWDDLAEKWEPPGDSKSDPSASVGMADSSVGMTGGAASDIDPARRRRG